MSIGKEDSVTCVIKCPDGRILIQDHVKNDAWTIPGGKMEPGEEPYQAICRELAEELNVHPSYLDIYRCIEVRHASDDGWVSEHRYYAHVNAKFVCENREPEKHRWIEFKTLEEIMAAPKKSIVLKSYLEHNTCNN